MTSLDTGYVETSTSTDSSWSYDDNGNVTAEWVYDASGAVRADAGHRFFHDAQNRLVKVQEGNQVVAEYLYDMDGYRIVKKDWRAGTESFYVRGEEGRLLSEFRRRLTGPAQAPVWARDHIYLGDRLVAAAQDAAPSPPGQVEPSASAWLQVPAWVRLVLAPSPDPDVQTYRISKTPPSGVPVVTEIEAPPSGDVDYVDGDVTPGQMYTFTVRAVDGAMNESAETAPVLVTPNDNTPPPAPEGPSATAGDRTVSLTWTYANKPLDHYGYLVERRQSGETFWTRLTPKPVLATSFTDTLLTNRLTCEYRILARDTAGLLSAPSATSSATPDDVTPPAAPRGLVATADTAWNSQWQVMQHRVELWWSASPEPDVQQYRIYYTADPAVPCSPLWSVPREPTSYVHEGRAASSTYYYQVSAVDDDGNESALSEEVAVTTRNDQLSALGLRNVFFSHCSQGFWFPSYGPGGSTWQYASDVEECLLPGNNLVRQGISYYEPWVETPWSHLNYRAVQLTTYPPEPTKFRLYRRRGPAEPLESVSAPAPHGNLDGWPGQWPVSYTGQSGDPTCNPTLESSCYQWDYFDLGAEDFCTPSFEYRVAAIDPNDPSQTAEGPLSAPVTATSVLPVPENFRFQGNPSFPDMMSSWDANTVVPPMVVRWDGYKGACREDFAGFRVYRNRLDSVVGSAPGSPDIEVTEGPTWNNFVEVRLPHFGSYFGWRVPYRGLRPQPSRGFAPARRRQREKDLLRRRRSVRAIQYNRPFVMAVRAVDGYGGHSRFSNAVWTSANALHGPCNRPQPDCEGKSVEAPTFGHTWEPPLQPRADQSAAPTLGYARSFEVLTIWPCPDANRIRIYRDTSTPGGVNRERVAELPGDDQAFAPQGWRYLSTLPGEMGGEVEPNPVMMCDPNVAYRASWVDHQGRESPLSAALAAPGPTGGFVGSSPLRTQLDGNNTIVRLWWDSVPDCGTLAGYHVWRADIPESQVSNCTGWSPTGARPAERLTGIVPTRERVLEDVDPPGDNGNTFVYWVEAVNTDGTVRATTNRVCTSANAAWLGPSFNEREPWKVASARGGASASPEESSREGGWERGALSSPRVIGQSAPEVEVIYFHSDHLGTPVVVTDIAGKVLSRHKYLPFGEEMSPIGANTHSRRFTGHERDAESGLDYMLARYYISTAGRFLSVDAASRSINALNPQTWNRYS